MNERILARLLFGFGLLTLGLVGFFGSGGFEAGALENTVFFAAAGAAVVGLGLDIKHRRQNKKRRPA